MSYIARMDATAIQSAEMAMCRPGWSNESRRSEKNGGVREEKRRDEIGWDERKWMSTHADPPPEPERGRRWVFDVRIKRTVCAEETSWVELKRMGIFFLVM